MVLGIMAVGFVLVLFMLGERPVGLLLFKRKDRPLEDQTPEEQTPKEGALLPVPKPGNNAA